MVETETRRWYVSRPRRRDRDVETETITLASIKLQILCTPSSHNYTLNWLLLILSFVISAEQPNVCLSVSNLTGRLLTGFSWKFCRRFIFRQRRPSTKFRTPESNRRIHLGGELHSPSAPVCDVSQVKQLYVAS